MNGNQVDIIKVHGMMSIFLEEGENDICFQYEIPGGELGKWLSLISGIIWIIYTFDLARILKIFNYLGINCKQDIKK